MKSPQEPGFARQYFLSENIGLCPVHDFLMKIMDLYNFEKSILWADIKNYI